MIALELARAGAVCDLRNELCALIRDTLEHGASIGFVLPLANDVLADYLDGVAREVEAGKRLVVVARDGGHVVGTVHLALVGWPNGRHRAEVQKLMVHSAARRQGLATRLMAEIESLARANGRTLLILDTISGSEADPLYRRLGYVEAGEIPDYAAMPDGVLAPTTVFYKHLT
jgi:acetyltransferase